jgi:hypothetical protein
VAKRKKPRTSPLARQPEAAPPLVDKVVRTAEQPGDFDVSPLLAALRVGALDEHLEAIGEVINDRIRALNAIDELKAASRLHVGDHVHLGHNLKPQYLHGRAVTIIAKDGEKWVVRLDEPVGRFTNADLRVQAIQLETL